MSNEKTRSLQVVGGGYVYPNTVEDVEYNSIDAQGGRSGGGDMDNDRLLEQLLTSLREDNKEIKANMRESERRLHEDRVESEKRLEAARVESEQRSRAMEERLETSRREAEERSRAMEERLEASRKENDARLTASMEVITSEMKEIRSEIKGLRDWTIGTNIATFLAVLGVCVATFWGCSQVITGLMSMLK